MKMIHNVACSILLFLASAIPSSAQNGWTYYPSSDFFPGAKTTHVVIDSNGKAWADTHWRFFTLEDWGWRIVNAPDYPSYPHYFFRTFDPSGNLWVGTPQGVSRFDGTAWKHFTDADVLPSEVGRSIAFGSGGDIWIGTDEYVSKISGDKIVSWNVPGYVTSLATAPDGSVWAGMLYKGIYRFNGREWVCMSSNYEEQWTTCMKIDRTGRVWCLSRNGVSYYEDGRWKYYPCGPFQTTVGGYLIEIAPDGSVWVLFGECLCIFDGTTWRDVNLPKVFNTIHTRPWHSRPRARSGSARNRVHTVLTPITSRLPIRSPCGCPIMWSKTSRREIFMESSPPEQRTLVWHPVRPCPAGPLDGRRTALFIRGRHPAQSVYGGRMEEQWHHRLEKPPPTATYGCRDIWDRAVRRIIVDRVQGA